MNNFCGIHKPLCLNILTIKKLAINVVTFYILIKKSGSK